MLGAQIRPARRSRPRMVAWVTAAGVGDRGGRKTSFHPAMDEAGRNRPTS